MATVRLIIFFIFISEKPGAPENVAVSDIGCTDVTLSWKAPASDGGAPVTRYIVEKQEVPGGEWVLATVTKKKEVKVGGLAENTAYNFR